MPKQRRSAFGNWTFNAKSDSSTNLRPSSLRPRKRAGMNTLVVMEADRQRFFADQTERNSAIDRASRPNTWRHIQTSIVAYCDMVLADSEYPDFFSKNSGEIDYYRGEATSSWLTHAHLAPHAIPTLIEVNRTVAEGTRLSKRTRAITKSQNSMMNLLYQVVLRTVHELFNADIIKALEAVTFNGYVRLDRPCNGERNKRVSSSLQARRNEFKLVINLAQVDPKACFRQL